MLALLLVLVAHAAPDPCKRAKATVEADPFSGQRTVSAKVDLEGFIWDHAMVQRRWTLDHVDGGSTVLGVVTWLGGGLEVTVKLAHPIELALADGSTITLRHRKLTTPGTIKQQGMTTTLPMQTVVTELPTEYALTRAVAERLAAHPPVAVRGDWGTGQVRYDFDGGEQKRLAALFACAATVAPDLGGVIGGSAPDAPSSAD